MNNLTEGYFKVLSKACEISENYNLKYVGTEEIIYAILTTIKCNACKYLNKFGATKENFFAYLRKTFKVRHDVGYTAKANNAILRSKEIANSLKLSYVSTEHLLLAILEIQDCNATSILRAIGVDCSKLYAFIYDNVKPNTQPINTESTKINNYSKNDRKSKILDNTEKNKENSNFEIAENDNLDNSNPLTLIGYDMTLKAKSGKIDKVIGREVEIERILQTLSRKTKNSPILLGEAGVGKTAVVEGLALKISQGTVPEFLINKRIFSLSLASLISGTRYRGDFEEKLKSAIDYAINDGNIIFFIDEIHNIVGSGSTKEGSLDIAEMLKPMLSRGEIMLIGATTFDEYTKFIEKDGALDRRFQPIEIKEPSIESSILILKGIKSLFEAHHKVFISEKAIESAVILSKRYINDRFLPDKAIDLIDEASSKKRLEITSTPSKIIELEDKIKQFIADRDYSLHISDLEKAKKIDIEISKLKDKVEEEKIKNYKKRSVKNPTVNEEDIKNLISLWTNIPINNLSSEDNFKMSNLEDELYKKIIGQNQAIEVVSRAIRRSRANLKDPNKPIGSFIFVGPTGVGKSELCKALAELVFGSQDDIVRFDMSEYQDKTSINKLIGSAPGYVGYENEGLLIKKIKRKPYSIVLFDEIEKANSDIFDLLLQILDEGRLTDSKGRTVSFKNALIILTSNLGYFSEEEFTRSLGFGSEISQQNAIEKALKKTFKPEFINRLDEIVVFNNLTKNDCLDIADMQINELINRVKEQNIFVTVDNSAVDYVVEKSYSKEYGARPIKRAITKYVEEMLSDAIIDKKITKNDKIVVYCEDEQMKFKKV